MGFQRLQPQGWCLATASETLASSPISFLTGLSLPGILFWLEGGEAEDFGVWLFPPSRSSSLPPSVAQDVSSASLAPLQPQSTSGSSSDPLA